MPEDEDMGAADGGRKVEREAATIGRILLEPGHDRETRIEALRVLVTGGALDGAKEILDRAAGRPENRDVLPFIIRSYGYLTDPAAFPELRRWLDHADHAVAVNAGKAMVILDPARAVAACQPLLSSSSGSLAFALAEMLAQRCPQEAEAFFMSMAFSRKKKHRALAIAYLRGLPEDEAIPLILEMIRRERKSSIRSILMKLLGSKVAPGDVPRLLQFQRELLEKVGELETALQGERGTEDPDDSQARLRQALVSLRLESSEDG